MMRAKNSREQTFMRTVIGVVLSSLLMVCGACSDQSRQVTNAVKPATTAATEAAKLLQLTDEYFARFLELNPVLATSIGDRRYNDRLSNDIGQQWLADLLELEQDYLMRLNTVDAAKLDPAARLTYDIFKYGRQLNIAGAVFRDELIPVNQFQSAPVEFGRLGSGQSVQPFETVKDYEGYLHRIDGFVVWVDQAIANMQAGVDSGVAQPRVVVEKCLPQLASFIVDDPQKSLLYKPIEAFPDAVQIADRKRLAVAYQKAIKEKAVPAYRKLHDYMKNDYLPKARVSVGMNALPQGAKWYAFKVRASTTTDLSPEQIHDIGLKEMARLRGEMERVKTQVGFKGELKDFFTQLRNDPQFFFKDREDLLNGYRALKATVTAELPKLFEFLPKADFEVRAVEAFRERSEAAASYQAGTPDGKRLGVFYVNTYDLPSRPRYMMETIFLHEAVPGHHMQIALQYEMPDLPSFRRFTNDTAFTEGWGLYAESLGRELGQYKDPYQYFGSLTAEAWRAARLVVDTGMHAKGWTREQAIDYMRNNTALGETDIVAEVERYIAIPGQALAYKMGQLKIRELRIRAEQKLATKFNLREFHTQILKDGSMPLAVLDAKIDRWIASRQ